MLRSKPKQASTGSISYTTYYATRQVFNEEEENELQEYLTSNLHHGLTTEETRALAYKFATKKSKVMPSNWLLHKEAGKYNK